MIERDLTPRLRAAAERFPAVTITGPRQSGKSTLCRALFPEHPYVSLEAPDVRGFAQDDPRGFLARFPDGAVLDEIQRAPELPSYLQGLIDADQRPGRWILTGSQNFALLEAVNQSLAGRTAVLHLLPLARSEVERFERHPRTLDEALVAGGYPRIFDRDLDPSEWIASYVATYVERDVRTITRVSDLTQFQRFVELCAGRTAQLLNYSALAADCGITQPTAKAWLAVLEASFIVHRVPPYHANHRKRLVKMPKLHFLDSGVACWLLGIRSAEHVRSHPLRGALFESWVISEVLKARTNRGEPGGLAFYREHRGLEADLIVETPDALRVVEVKAGSTAKGEALTRLDHVRQRLGRSDDGTELIVVYGGDDEQVRSDGTLVPWAQIDGRAWV